MGYNFSVMKRFEVLIILVLLFVVIPVSAQVPTEIMEPTLEPTKEIHEFANWEYITNITGLTITAYHGNEKRIEIPDEIYGIRVTALADNLFKSNTTVQSVFIPDSVTSIGEYAFNGCSSLKEVRLPAGLTRLESYTFRYCGALENIEFPETLSVIASYAFAGCIGLTSVILPDSVTSVGEGAFSNCTYLSNIVISKNLEYVGANGFINTPWLEAQTDEFVIIGNNLLLKFNNTDSIVDIPYGVTFIVDAFMDNPYVETINLPSSIHRIGPNAFRNAVNLSSIEIPDSVTRIDWNAFRGCRSLREIVIPETVTYIGHDAFRGCEKLKSFTFPSRISTIYSYTLADCSVLTDVVIPANVTTIEGYAFNNSNFARLHVTYDSEGERYALEHNMSYTYYLQQTQDFIYSKNEDGIQILKYIGNLYDVDIPGEIDGLPVNRINTAAFQNNAVARRISVPNSVTSIGDWAFSYMDSLESVTLSTKLKSLGADAFAGSVGLRSITIPKSLEEIGVEPFAGLDHLQIIADGNSKAGVLLTEMGYLLNSEISSAGIIEENDLEGQENSDHIDEMLNNADLETSVGTDLVTEYETEIPTEIVVTETAMIAVTPTATQTSMTAAASTPTSTPTSTPAPTQTVPFVATETETLVPSESATETMIPTSTVEPVITEPEVIETTVPFDGELKSVLTIPDGATEITPSMLENTADVLTLIIPKSVTFIDDAIVSGHELTIVSSTSTEAERFARKWDLKFLIDLWYEGESDSSVR